MSPMMIRIFTLVGIALAAASLQLKARAGTHPGPLGDAGAAVVTVHAQGALLAARDG
jgi:hypothetical protein